MPRQHVTIHTVDPQTKKPLPVDLAFYDGDTEVFPTSKPSADGSHVVYTFSDCDPGTLVRVQPKDPSAWSLLLGQTYIPIAKDCRFDLLCAKAEKTESTLDCGAGVIELRVKLDWCKEDGVKLTAEPPHATVLAKREGEPVWKESKLATNGYASFLLPRGHCYQVSVPNACSSNASVFACGDASLTLNMCVRAEHILSFILRDCGKPAACAPCLVNGHEMLADQEGKVVVVNPPAETRIEGRGNFTFREQAVRMAGQSRRTVTIEGRFKKHSINLDIESEYDPADLEVHLSPSRGTVGQVHKLPLDPYGHLELPVGQAGKYLVKVHHKKEGTVHSSEIETEEDEPEMVDS
jgi:hypothetical protein